MYQLVPSETISNISPISPAAKVYEKTSPLKVKFASASSPVPAALTVTNSCSSGPPPNKSICVEVIPDNPEPSPVKLLALTTPASVTLNTSVPDDDCALINIANLASVPLLSLSILT